MIKLSIPKDLKGGAVQFGNELIELSGTSVTVRPEVAEHLKTRFGFTEQVEKQETPAKPEPKKESK